MSALHDTLDALPALTLTELKSVKSRVLYLIGTRHQEEARTDTMDRLIREHADATGRADGDEWVQPTSALDAYPAGAIHTHDGQTWQSLISANVWEPGVAGWRVITEDGTPPPYVQPSSAADAYMEGERITWTDGKIYAAVRDGVVHSPAEYAADWELVQDEGDDDSDDEVGDDDTVPAWESGTAYETGQHVTYQSDTYRILQAHTSQAHWTPDQVASLYEVVTE